MDCLSASELDHRIQEEINRAERQGTPLCCLLVTIGKVFLYDLGALQDLYRVGSLVGLAVSLILVSLLYQRFVFRKAPQERP